MELNKKFVAFLIITLLFVINFVLQIVYEKEFF